MTLRRFVSWIVALQAMLLSVLVIAVVGGTDVGVRVPTAVFAVVVAGCAPLLASLIALRNPRRAAQINLCVAPITPLLVLSFSSSFGFLFDPWRSRFGGLAVPLAVFSGAIVIPGLFWLLTSRRGWPPPLPISRFFRGSLFNALVVSVLSCILVAVAVLSSLFLPWWPRIGDCHGGPLLTEERRPVSIDFTARIVFVGPATFRGRSLWSVARVEQTFVRLPWRTSSLIILRGYFLPTDRDERYFVEGRRSEGAIDRFLPIIEPEQCGHTARLEDATIAMRIMHDGLPRSGVRLIGRVYRDWRSRRAAPGVVVRITGPAGSDVSTTDAEGIYDVSGLPPGHYTVELAAPNPHRANRYDLRDRDIREDAFYLQ